MGVSPVSLLCVWIRIQSRFCDAHLRAELKDEDRLKDCHGLKNINSEVVLIGMINQANCVT